ncbi:MAG: hypothetical protein ABIN58_13780, partial [candidate division WOR-3 bacterium]
RFLHPSASLGGTAQATLMSQAYTTVHRVRKAIFLFQRIGSAEVHRPVFHIDKEGALRYLDLVMVINAHPADTIPHLIDATALGISAVPVFQIEAKADPQLADVAQAVALPGFFSGGSKDRKENRRQDRYNREDDQ